MAKKRRAKSKAKAKSATKRKQSARRSRIVARRRVGAKGTGISVGTFAITGWKPASTGTLYGRYNRPAVPSAHVASKASAHQIVKMIGARSTTVREIQGFVGKLRGRGFIK